MRLTLEIHRADNALPGNLQALFNPVIPKILPNGVTVQVYLHPEKPMHNRFILTDIGGAVYKTGLDDNEDGEASSEDVVTLLAPEGFDKEWRIYSAKPTFLTYL